MSTIPNWMKRWDALEANRLIERIKMEVAPHWHVGLTGSLLTESHGNDLDLILYPHDNSDVKLEFLRSKLANIMDRVRTVEETHEHWKSKGRTDRKRVEIYHYELRRVDIFILE